MELVCRQVSVRIMMDSECKGCIDGLGFFSRPCSRCSKQKRLDRKHARIYQQPLSSFFDKDKFWYETCGNWKMIVRLVRDNEETRAAEERKKLNGRFLESG